MLAESLEYFGSLLMVVLPLAAFPLPSCISSTCNDMLKSSTNFHISWSLIRFSSFFSVGLCDFSCANFKYVDSFFCEFPLPMSIFRKLFDYWAFHAKIVTWLFLITSLSTKSLHWMGQSYHAFIYLLNIVSLRLWNVWGTVALESLSLIVTSEPFYKQSLLSTSALMSGSHFLVSLFIL